MKQDRIVSDPMTFWWIWWFWRIWWIWWFWWIWNLVKITETQDVCSWYAFCKSVIIEREASVITLNIKWSERKSGENYWKAGCTPSSTSPLLLSPSKCPGLGAFPPEFELFHPAGIDNIWQMLQNPISPIVVVVVDPLSHFYHKLWSRSRRTQGTIFVRK